MVFQAFGVPTPAIESMLTTIQEMRFYLRTGYGDSSDFAGGKSSDQDDPIKPQGMCQGNGAAPAAWTAMTIPMINAQRRKGHGAFFTSPISKLSTHLIGGLYVDDTDLIHANMNISEDLESAHSGLQEAVESWGKLLIGGRHPLCCPDTPMCRPFSNERILNSTNILSVLMHRLLR